MANEPQFQLRKYRVSGPTTEPTTRGVRHIGPTTKTSARLWVDRAAKWHHEQKHAITSRLTPDELRVKSRSGHLLYRVVPM